MGQFLYQIIVSLLSIFVNKIVTCESCECAFTFLTRNVCVKDRKIGTLAAGYLVEILNS